MKRTLLAAALIAIAGCTPENSGNLTQAKLDSIQPGMTLSEADAILGSDRTSTEIMDGLAMYQWTAGGESDFCSILVTTDDGKITKKSGTNLPR